MWVPGGTPADVAAAVRTATNHVGQRSGWHRLCDRLVCRAYGHANSGYPTATAHWNDLQARGLAHPGDRCPPLGAFEFWSTRHIAGHVAVVLTAAATTGGVYQVPSPKSRTDG